MTIIETDGNHWDTEQISWDGLKEIKLEHHIITGFSYNPMHDTDEWIPFTYDLDSRILIGGTYYGHEKPW